MNLEGDVYMTTFIRSSGASLIASSGVIGTRMLTSTRFDFGQQR